MSIFRYADVNAPAAIFGNVRAKEPGQNHAKAPGCAEGIIAATSDWLEGNKKAEMARSHYLQDLNQRQIAKCNYLQQNVMR